MGTVNDALRVAAAEIGYVEQPVNRNKYSAAAGRPAESWCADFCEWVLRQAGIAIPVNTYGNAGTLVRSFPQVATPRPGDLVGYHFPGESAGIDHVGIVESFDPVRQLITSIEGNTSSDEAGVQSNGGGVYRRVRSLSLAVAFGRPPYVSEVPPMINPPVAIAGKVVATLNAPGGGVWMLTDVGAVYAWNCPDHDAPNRHSYWGSRTAAQLLANGNGYTVVASSGERYDYPA